MSRGRRAAAMSFYSEHPAAYDYLPPPADPHWKSGGEAWDHDFAALYGIYGKKRRTRVPEDHS